MRTEINLETGEILELEDAPIIERPKEEVEAEILSLKIQEANQYLKDTDWVNSYKIRHDLGLELIHEESSKWLIINKREEYIVFLKAIEGSK